MRNFFVNQEFFLLLIEEIFDNKYGMFKTIEDSEKVWFNRQVYFNFDLNRHHLLRNSEV